LLGLTLEPDTTTSEFHLVILSLPANQRGREKTRSFIMPE
jgi:hypothetical protein